MAGSRTSNKAKIAKRLVDIFEFFDEESRQVTVMDIVRRYDWPQSSTSELLASLVELGLVYKDPFSRTYSLSQRAAMLGSAFQPAIIRDGRLIQMIDGLVGQTGLAVATFGIVGIHSQLFSWRAASLHTLSGPQGLYGGQQERLSDSAAGWLLLSTIVQSRRDGMVRRLLADAASPNKSTFTEISARIASCRDHGYAVGPVGCGSGAEVAVILLPGQPEGHPLALGFVYEPSPQIDAVELINCLRHSVDRAIASAGAPQISFPGPLRESYASFEPEMATAQPILAGRSCQSGHASNRRQYGSR
jgi:DNA-binding IclR family transcriptional regulator